MEETLKILLIFLPLIAQLAHKERVGQLVQELTQIGIDEADRIAAERGQTRDEVVADATKTWVEAVQGADDLLKLGHDDPPAQT